MKCVTQICLIIIGVVIIASCGNSNDKVNNKVINTDTLDKTFVNVNHELVKKEEKEITNFIERYGWKMQQTGTGLRYMIYKNGSGVKAEKNKIAKINFEVKLITGDLCYSSKTDGSKELLIGKSGEISGLEEGILLLRVGDKAKFIVPSHLAYGLLGDENKIPKRATLVYDIELLEIK
jgi:FKBP-type peptidyl-prolyl cis-trans isomerase FkpA